MFELLLLAGAGLLLAKHKADASDKLSYEIRSGKLDRKASSLKKLVGTITVAITNPTPTDIAFNSFSGALGYKGTQIGTTDYYQKVDILPQKVTTIEMPVQISTSGLGKSLIQIIKGLFKKENPVLDVSGTLNFSAGSLKVSYPQEFTIV